MELKPYFKFLVHVFIWIAFIFGPIWLIPEVSNIFNQDPEFLYLYIGASAVSIVVFYLIDGYAIPKFFLQKKYVFHFLFIVGLIFVCLFLTRVLLLWGEYGGKPDIESIQSRRVLAAFIPKLIIVLVVSHALGIYRKYKDNEIEKTKAQLKYLKAQINPHFLFNTLNGLYGLAIIKSDKTAKGISHLSNIMRYVMTESQEPFVPLKSEVDYILNYVNLQKLRLTDKTKVIFNLSGDPRDKLIIPLLLITYLENSFKFGVSTEVESFININIEITDDYVMFYVGNKKINTGTPVQESHKIGLENARKRLELMYQNKYELKIKNSTDHYETSLKLFFDK